jgi:Colicin immunity protein / pyocin immunity protein
MTKNELIELGKRIVAAKGSDDEINELMEIFDKNVPHPNGSNLFYYPENYDARTKIVSEYNPIVEEVVELCLAYTPISI